MNEEQIKETGCCPEFNPDDWDDKNFEWKDKLFIKDSIPEFLHLPLPFMFGKAMTRLHKKAEKAGAMPETKDFLCLAYDPSPWKGEFYMAVTREVPDAENVRISGEFITRVFDGPYNAVPKWIKIMDTLLQGKGLKAKKYYFYYTTCPKCAKVYGHNFVVVFAEI
jgi:hypothetical protein